MAARDVPAVKLLMRERRNQRIPDRRVASKSTDHTESKISKMPSVEKSKEKIPRRTLEDISADLQRAMAARDVPAVKLLMRERRNIVAK